MPRPGLLDGRRALVTGAARGIGLATARRFCEEGASVALSDVLAGEVEAAVADLSAAGREATAVPFDVTDEAAVEQGFAEARQRLGGLDTVVANAGILKLGEIADQELAAFRAVLDVNLVGVFLCLRAAARLFRERGDGVILATASQAGLHGYPGLGAYCATKFGVRALVEALAKELGPQGIRVNAVAPGMISTEMHDAHMAGLAAGPGAEPGRVRERLLSGVPLGRLGSPEEVANVFVFLASGLASYVSGATVLVEGGECT